MADRHSISIGDTFNRWTYLGQDRRANKRTFALFRCSCGTERIVSKSSVIHGESKSCGCQRIDSAKRVHTTHGQSRAGSGSAYASWESMMRRCYKQYASRYDLYGGRGIEVCERWHKFENFLEDMGRRPVGKTLDRYPDKNGNYEPGNCRWATQTEQMYNTRDAHEVEYCGTKTTTGDLAIASGVSIDTIRYRLNQGLPVEQVIDPNSRRERLISHDGRSMSMTAWEKHLGLNRGTIQTRLRRGKSIEEALAPARWKRRKKS
jgi:hypothetical protein